MPALSTSKIAVPILICLALTGCFKSSEERAAEHYESGLALLEQGDPDRAMVEFRNTLKYSEGNIEARRKMAEIHLDRGRKRQAYRNFLAVVEQQPNDVAGRTVLSELAFDLGSWQEFERHATEALELTNGGQDAEPGVLKARVEALELALRMRTATIDEDASTQAAIVTEAAERQVTSPDNAILRKILVNGYVAQTRYEEALVQIDKSIEAEPRVIDNYGARLELLGRMGNEDGVEAELNRMVELFPDDANVKSTFLRYLSSRGKLEEAESFLRAQVDAAQDEARVDNFATLIAFILRTRGTEAALAEVNSAIEATPSENLRLMRASLTFDTGEAAAAIREMEEIVAVEDSTLTPLEMQQAKVALARMLTSTGNEVGARQRVEEVLADDPNAPGALKLKAVWQIEEDNTESAINGLRTALAANPQDVDAMGLMAQAYERAGNTDLMLNFLAQAVEASNNAPAQSLRYARALVTDDKALQAESVLINSLRISPGNVDVLSLLGQIYLQLEDTGRARQVVQTLDNMDNPQAKANATSLNLELVAQERGADEALRLLEQLASDAGAEGDDQVKLSVIQGRLRTGDTDGALNYANELLEEEPDNVRFRYAKALTHMAVGDLGSAETDLRRILETEPGFAQVWLQLARIKTANNEDEAALALLNDGLDEIPGAPDLLWGKASMLQRLGDVDGAIEIFEALYEQNSGSLIVANNLASLLSTYRKNDPASIERAARIARRLSSAQLPAFQDTYGWIAHLNGNSEEALRYLEPAAAGLPRDAAVQVHLGLVYAALGQRENALAQLRRALEVGGPLAGNEALLDEARATIAELEAAPAAPDAPATPEAPAAAEDGAASDN